MEETGAVAAKIDEFLLLRRLGQGGMGEVWLARDTLLERDVAIKFGLGAMSNEARLRFQIEARAVARLQHPNILAVHHAGELRDQPFLVTELLHGKSLDTLGRIPPDEVVTIGIDLSRALAAAHAAGVIHRDIKPANAFLCDDGAAKLLDFGLAQLRDDAAAVALDATQTAGAGADSSSGQLDATQAAVSLSGRLAGTPLYMAPETWGGESATPATDVYSLGALLATLLTGRPAYLGDTMDSLRQAVLAGPLLDLAAAAPDAPPALVDLILRSLGRRPDVRPPAEELCNALQSLAAAQATAREDAARSDAGDPGGNPYRGLLSFGAEHHGLFFGRETETAAVLTELAGSPFVLVVGMSGAGKSSLVRAGVVPRVLAGALGRGPWRVATTMPGERPIERLAQAVAPVLGVTEGEALAELQQTPSWAAERLVETAREGRSLLLVLDQFEECWTLSSATDRATFFEALAAFANVDTGARVRLVATLRADFLGRMGDLGELRALALRAPVMLGPLSSDGLRRAIVEPARRRGVEIDPSLADALVDRARGATGMLPLLEFALGVLWERRDDSVRRITLADLDAQGGLEGTLATHADAALARLPPRLRDDAKRILLALVTVDRTRARREERELLGSSADAHAALDALTDARLVVATAGEDTTAYEVAHEVLLTGWPRLRGWLDEEAAAREALERVRRGVAEWERLGRAPEALWNARQLDELEVVAEGAVPPDVARFVAASRAALRRARRRRIVLAIAAPFLLALVGGAVWGASYARHQAAVARAVAAARGLEAKAEESARAAEETRARAFATFEKDDLGPAEKLWKEALALEDATDDQRRAVADALDRALALDARDPTTRALVADVTLERLLAAERRHEKPLVEALRAALDAYDDGSRAAGLVAPGHVTAVTEPPGAALTLARYREDDAGRLVESDAAPLPSGERRGLPPGSYLIVAQAEGRYSTRYPFVLRRGEESMLRVVLPRAEDVPEGMVYVPAGRTLYGSADDERTRAFYTHQPSHDVEVGAFLIAKTEVTNAEYVAFLAALPDSERKARLTSGLMLLLDGRIAWKFRSKVLAPGESYCSGAGPCVDWSRLPVNGASREDGEQFAAWLARSGRLPGARLCTDREWERAARGADDRQYPSGNRELGPEDACSLATYAGDSSRAGPCTPGTHPASRSPFGVDDLAGSEWEWTSGPPDVAQATQGTTRSAGFFDFSLYLAIANRGVQGIGSRYNGFGIRVCSDVR